jgi:L-seryl-tRNA(Ser) seleniumtransferase
MSRLFSNFPSVNDLLESAPLKGVVQRFGKHRAVSEAARYLDRLRQQAQTAAQHALHFSTNELASRVARWIAATAPSGQRSVINATGILLPSDLVGPPLATEAIDAMAHVGGAYHSGDQLAAVSSLLQRFAGSEATLVFPSASAAMLAALSALAAGREVVLRRGELERDPVELSLDELTSCAGVRIREVGSVNETRLSDYEQAIGDQTAAILSITLRNSVIGSAAVPDLKQLAALTTQRRKPLVADMGWSGLIDLSKLGLSALTTARAAHDAGVDLMLLRGHGAIGGPACGILTGRSELIEQIARHPFARAAQATDATLAALTATLQLYDDEGCALRTIPLLSLLSTPAENLRLRAERLAPQFAAMGAVARAEAVPSQAFLGGRRLPLEAVPSWAVAITPATGSPAEFAAQLLSSTQAIAAQVEGEQVVLNLRTVAPKYDLALIDAIATMTGTAEQPPAPQ